MRLIRAALLSLACAAPAAAQDQITPDAFLDEVEGRTATFYVWGTNTLVGIETFERRDRSVWARSDGTCAYGVVTVRDVRICFAYDDEPTGREHCWIPFRDGDTLLVLDDDGSEVQEITQIDDKPVDCSPPPIS